MSGKVILLNGASSSGKSSIARALRESIEEPFWLYSIDHLREANVLPLDRIQRGDFQWPQMREAFFEGFHRSLPSFAQPGNNLIVEHVIETEAWMKRLIMLLEGIDVFFVGVHCPIQELQRRESARGDRRLGSARQDYETIHQHASYDFELNSLEPPADCAQKVLAAWRQPARPTAFERMAKDVIT